MPARRLVIALALAVGTVGGAACSDGSDSDGADRSAAASTTTTVVDAPDRSSTSTTVADPGPLPPAVEPTTVPAGSRPLRAPGIGVGVAVPDTWTITDLRGDDLTAAQAEAAVTDPQLSGLLAEGGALLEDARALAAIGPAGPEGTPLVTIIQLDVVVPDVPADLEQGVRDQVEGYGATDVVVDRIALPGLAEGRRALRLQAGLVVAGVPQQLQAIIVPTTAGIAVVTVRDGGAGLDQIVGSLAAS